MFTADQVWGAAAAAQRINGEYLKEDKGRYTDDGYVLDKRANKAMVKQWLRDNDFTQVTEVDYAAGRTARDHFKSYTLLALAGKLNDFQATAMKLAAKEEFTGRDLYDFSVISCLPSVAVRDQERTELKREIYSAQPLAAAVGETVIGDITVISSRYNPNFGKYRIQARLNESFVDFWFSKELAGELRVKAKVKALRPDNTAQLNYVKVL
jgi:hypothetical protein